MWSGRLAEVHATKFMASRVVQKRELSGFECGVVVGARRAGLSISETADLQGFSHSTISRVYKREWLEREKISLERQLRG